MLLSEFDYLINRDNCKEKIIIFQQYIKYYSIKNTYLCVFI